MVTSTPKNEKNIWVAASDGDLDRIQELVENDSLSPNIADPNTYTPMHAAASYGHLHVLEYLISKGGDVNVKDEDEETPLFTAESVEVARWLVDHGAMVDYRNRDGNTAAQHLAEDFPLVSRYLHSLGAPGPPSSDPAVPPSSYTTDQAASQLTQSLMLEVQTIIQRAEAEGRDPEAELREAVGRAVLGGVVTGAELGFANDAENVHGRRQSDQINGKDSKRPRIDDEGR